jgi:hypothetical protein
MAHFNLMTSRKALSKCLDIWGAGAEATYMKVGTVQPVAYTFRKHKISNDMGGSQTQMENRGEGQPQVPACVRTLYSIEISVITASKQTFPCGMASVNTSRAFV